MGCLVIKPLEPEDQLIIQQRLGDDLTMNGMISSNKHQKNNEKEKMGG
jgi:hypothetical protein